jgi:hypothetical protein
MGAVLVWENEGSQAALRFGSIHVQEGDHRRHAMRERGRMGAGGLGVLRKEKGPGWAGGGPQRCYNHLPRGPSSTSCNYVVVIPKLLTTPPRGLLYE